MSLPIQDLAVCRSPSTFLLTAGHVSSGRCRGCPPAFESRPTRATAYLSIREIEETPANACGVYSAAMVKHALAMAFAVAAVGLAATPLPRQDTAVRSDAEIEQFLRKAKVIKTRNIGKGVTNSVRVTLTDGTITHDAHVQSIDEAKVRFDGTQGTELNFRDSWRFNVAAYRIDRMIGLNLVPVSVERSLQSRAAAFTWWIDDVLMDEGERSKTDQQPPNIACYNAMMRGLRVFDQLIDNIDRNAGNFVITKSWRLWGIDHTRAFRYSKTPRKPEHLTQIDRSVLEKLRGLNFPEMKQALRSYLPDSDIRNVLARRDAIVAHFEKLPGVVFDRPDPSAGCLAATPGSADRH